jgi:membrane-associated phospholipid phosphatase
MRRPRVADGVALRAAAVGVAAAALLAAVYVLAVWTHTGQRFEDAVLNAVAGGVNDRQAYLAQLILNTVRRASLAAAIAGILTLGWLGRRAYAGILAAGVIVAATLTTQVLQAVVERPILLSRGYRREDQSFPSGHAAIAMAVLAALVLVVPHRFRWYAVVVAAPGAIGVGLATVTVGWHRPSDVVGSDLIVLAYACLAIVLLARRGHVYAAEPRRAHAIAFGVASVGLCVVVLLILSTRDSVFALGRTIVLVAGSLTTLVLLGLIHGVEFGPPPSAEEGRPQRAPAAMALERDLEDGREEPSRHD